ncbi:guanylate kinase [Sulfitobacter geojensis]|uniref:Guanylate kinase n=1 Tax=Sulfitobacter geojensis TaxID=1342299 RepID=A0AAE2VW26_9RHOB|nr:guanylate kinase [Sulfitobacter geojensis]MBM1688212.1 guanylate kinase [Sulfitobacter geojensis]MBM1692279.1 guanylate kinase [Sulfitobacter geojensis]MBM1704445.1 guanylate kinase [Sulfitobacter geojensis]MBM1708503.1 guanylate kinase [Sulfitobacter geojensis]MBM1712568.1 guanylate kinase [Sulfitobacter geojensis]
MSRVTPERRGLLIILSSPSGAGKSTLAKRLMEWDPSLEFSVSATTRPPRSGEVDKKDYYFVTQEDFRRWVTEGEMLEHAHVFGNNYGSPKSPVEEAISAGKDVLFDIDWQGAQQIKTSSLSSHTLSIFILPPSIAELKRRLVSRGQDTPETIAKRMRKSWDEISHWDGYDYVLINDNLDETEAKLKTIIEAERMRVVQQPRLKDRVRQLQTEFEEDT